MLSESVQRRLDQAAQNQNTYQPNPVILSKLNQKTLIMIVAPVATGKTHLIRQISRHNPAYAPVRTIVTREPRDDDGDMFVPMPHDDEQVTLLLDMIDAGKLVQYAVHRETGRIYATRPEDYPSQYNLLATLSHVVTGLRNRGFGTTKTYGLVTDPEAWKQWLMQRYPEASEERDRRLEEAITSLEFMLSDPEIVFLYNHPDHIELTAESLIISDGSHDYRQHATEMLAAARLLS